MTRCPACGRSMASVDLDHVAGEYATLVWTCDCGHQEEREYREVTQA